MIREESKKGKERGKDGEEQNERKEGWKEKRKSRRKGGRKEGRIKEKEGAEDKSYPCTSGSSIFILSLVPKYFLVPYSAPST